MQKLLHAWAWDCGLSKGKISLFLKEQIAKHWEETQPEVGWGETGIKGLHLKCYGYLFLTNAFSAKWLRFCSGNWQQSGSQVLGRD